MAARVAALDGGLDGTRAQLAADVAALRDELGAVRSQADSGTTSISGEAGSCAYICVCLCVWGGAGVIPADEQSIQ
jgi:hypothetical protein